MKWTNNIFTMPANFCPEADTMIPVNVNGERGFRALLITRCGEVFIDSHGIPNGFSAKSIACLAATSYVVNIQELHDFIWAKEMPPVPVEPTPSGSWLIYLKYKKTPVRLCETKEDAIKWIDKASLLGLVFWPHDMSWFMIKERITNGS